MMTDPEMKELAEAEMKSASERLPEIERELQNLLLPKDSDDERNVFLEIRAGTGGDESALFAGNLFRMYSRFAERQRWQVEVVSSSASDVGGYKEVIARIVGNGVYSRLKFESGTHRVQRVPETEAQGRIHTSACTVAIMPEADELEDVQINPAPFCLLDEVDAPLDDSNTERFCKMVKKMSGATQFLFISHNKIAMEMAEQLVGVTMQESGVSRVVEVDIQEALKMRDAA